MTEFRNLDKYPRHLRGIVQVLLENEDFLSDGYGYYLPAEECVDKRWLYIEDGQTRRMTMIAQEIYEIKS